MDGTRRYNLLDNINLNFNKLLLTEEEALQPSSQHPIALNNSQFLPNKRLMGTFIHLKIFHTKLNRKYTILCLYISSKFLGNWVGMSMWQLA